MKVIDAHAHLGSCRVFDLNVDAQDLLRGMDENGVEAAIVMPFPGAPNAPATHDAIAELAQAQPGRIYGMINLNPHQDEEAYAREVRRCLRDLKFVGIKLHTIGHAINPLSKDATKVFELARELKVPVMVHTGPGIPFSSPALCLPRAIQYPDVSLVLAHAGFIFLTGEAWAVAQQAPNIYLEASWLYGDDVEWLVQTLGPERVMMGADLPKNVKPTLTIAASAGLTEKEKALFLGGTASKVFGIPS